MLVSTLLVILLSCVALSTNSSCDNCPWETIESVKENRIPAKVTEWICAQPGLPCGAKNLSTVNSYKVPRNIEFVLNFFYSVTN